MPFPKPVSGLVISYTYLWHSEHEEDRGEGVKDRPCAIVLAAQDEEGDTVVTVLPVTHIPPAVPDEAVELPLKIKRRLGLDSERSWIALAETNRFIWPGPDLRPVSRDEPGRFDYGVLPPSFFRQVRERFLARLAGKKVKKVHRSH